MTYIHHHPHMNTDNSFQDETRALVERAKARDAVRWLACLSTHGQSGAADRFAQLWPRSLHVDTVRRKDAVGAIGDTGTARVAPRALTEGFRTLAERRTIYGGLVRLGVPTVPFRTPVGRSADGGTFAWVQAGHPAPVGTLSYAADSGLDALKLVGLYVSSRTALEHVSPHLADVVVQDMSRGYGRQLDTTLLDPANTGVPDQTPASLTAGAASLASTGIDTAAMRMDLRRLVKLYAHLDASAEHATLITSTSIWLAITIALPDVARALAAQMPILTSDFAPASLILLDRSQLYAADEGVLDLDLSMQASLEMFDSSLLQDGTTGTGATQTSLWQAGLVGLRLQRYINWRCGLNAVAMIGPVLYNVSGSPA